MRPDNHQRVRRGSRGRPILVARYVLLAVGMVDIFPAIPGLRENWGRGVHHCPFCDGFEHQGQPWGVLADDPAMLEHALFLRGWSGTMTVFTNGADTTAWELAPVEAAGLRVVRTPIARVLTGNGHSLGGLELADGTVETIESLWIRPKQQQTPVVQQLGLKLRDDGAIWRDDKGQTSQPGIFAAGDCASGPMQQAILAAADGARTIFPLVRELVAGRLANGPNRATPAGENARYRLPPRCRRAPGRECPTPIPPGSHPAERRDRTEHPHATQRERVQAAREEHDADEEEPCGRARHGGPAVGHQAAAISASPWYIW